MGFSVSSFFLKSEAGYQNILLPCVSQRGDVGLVRKLVRQVGLCRLIPAPHCALHVAQPSSGRPGEHRTAGGSANRQPGLLAGLRAVGRLFAEKSFRRKTVSSFQLGKSLSNNLIFGRRLVLKFGIKLQKSIRIAIFCPLRTPRPNLEFNFL